MVGENGDDGPGDPREEWNEKSMKKND